MLSQKFCFSPQFYLDFRPPWLVRSGKANSFVDLCCRITGTPTGPQQSKQAAGGSFWSLKYADFSTQPLMPGGSLQTSAKSQNQIAHPVLSLPCNVGSNRAPFTLATERPHKVLNLCRVKGPKLLHGIALSLWPTVERHANNLPGSSAARSIHVPNGLRRPACISTLSTSVGSHHYQMLRNYIC